jgi:LCP family protein required for cell wall assembly
MSVASRSALRAFGGRVAIALVLAATLTAVGVVGVNRAINSRVGNIRRVPVVVAAAPPAGANFLIIGSDSRAFVDTPGDVLAFGDPAKQSGKNSDTLMVAHVEPSAKRTFILSFPRDLLVTVPGLSGKNKINAAYSVGGPQAVIYMLKTDFDVDIHHYVEVDFKSFQDVVEAIGNVKVYFPYATRDDKTGVYALAPGCFPLDGPAALAYVRSRSPEYLIGGKWVFGDQDAPDLHRIARQQGFIKKLAALAIEKSLGDPFLALDIADRVLGDIKADEQLQRSDVNALIRAFRTVDVNDPSAVQFATLPVKPNPANPGSSLVLGPGADAVINRLRTFGDNTPRLPSVLPGQVRVKVLDGSGTGDEESVSQALAAQGFRAAGTGTFSGKHARTTQIRYAPNQAPSAKALLAYVEDAALVPDPSLSGAIVLVVGDSFVGITVPTTTTAPPVTVGPGPTTTTTATTTTLTPAPTTPATAPGSQACS